MPAPPAAWAELPFFRDQWPTIEAKLIAEPDWLPGPDRLFAALALTPPESVRVVLLGQDPYPTPGHAMGLAFSVAENVPPPRSLANIFMEMDSDLGGRPASGDLSHWARQGVLMLNTALSVRTGEAGSHAGWGWEQLAIQAVQHAQRGSSLAFLLWGNHAKKALKGLPRTQDLVLSSAHPSPLSARRGFFGSRPFSQINAWLAHHDETPIDWIGPQIG